MRSDDPFGRADPAPRRHARVWLDPATWQSRLVAPLDAATLTALDDWIVRGRAVVARRGEAPILEVPNQDVAQHGGPDHDVPHHDAPEHDASCHGASAHDGPEQVVAKHDAPSHDALSHDVSHHDFLHHDARRSDIVHLGVVLPPAAGKRRVAIVVDRRAVVEVAPPLKLDEALDPAPREWRAALADLSRRGAAVGTSFRIYGSLAWQAISGEPYVGPASDVDLLWSADGDERIRRVLRLLVDWETRTGLRADGELLLASGDGVAWRELLGDPRRVLVKHQDRVSLQPSPLTG